MNLHKLKVPSLAAIHTLVFKLIQDISLVALLTSICITVATLDEEVVTRATDIAILSTLFLFGRHGENRKYEKV
jgi:hypothetical protein